MKNNYGPVGYGEHDGKIGRLEKRVQELERRNDFLQESFMQLLLKLTRKLGDL
jgi:hypothetical protein